MIVELLALGRLRAEERAAAELQILALFIERLVDQEIFLLRADLRGDALRLVVAEQMEDPKLAKGLVKREVIRVVTPGTNLNVQSLEAGKNNYLLSIAYTPDGIGISAADVTTGDYYVTEVEDLKKLNDELMKYEPSEIICNESFYMSSVDLDDLKNSIVTLSSELGVSAGDVADSVYGAISSGIDTADAIGVVEEATKLAVGSFTDTTTAVDILSAAINAYGLESSQASQMSDYLITMQTLTKTSVGELAANMQAILPTAAAYNVQMDNLSGAYVIMAENGSSTAEATAYLESMLSELGDSGRQP